MIMNSNIVIYQTEDSRTQVEVKLDKETVWLNQSQLSQLFDKDRSVITKHINNVFREGELDEKSNVQILHISGSDKPVKFYNLDVIISVGYRVKSKQGTQFRIWANKVLKEFLVQGYALNNRLLQSQKEKLSNLNDAIKLISNLSLSSEIDPSIKSDFLAILDRFSSALLILDDYDYQRLNVISNEYEQSYILNYEEVVGVIEEMKSVSGNSALFGREKDDSLKSSISAIYQTFGGEDLYPSILAKAINLLYFLVKNHSFVDGNKRIAAALFLYFLQKNKQLDKINLDNNLLASLTLLIANSKPQERELILNIVNIMLKK